MKTERKVAIYARVSTNSGQNPEMQIRELQEYSKNRGSKIGGEFVDSGISGATDSRPNSIG
jgi:DNA invertase Pin-like site-specific DNA recombinase